MLKRLYVDNYRCMVNFEFVPQATQLILGANGSGKSTIFDTLLLLRDFTTGQLKLDAIIGPANLTAWDKRTEQRFELDVQDEGGLYTYKLVLTYDVEKRLRRVESETLAFNGRQLLDFDDGDVTIHSSDDVFSFSGFSLSQNQSAFVVLSERKDHHLHRRFCDWLANIQLIRINPFNMAAVTDQEHSQLHWSAYNFSSWFRYLIQDSPDLIEEIKQSLADVWTGFKGLRLESAGPNTKLLKVMLDQDLNGTAKHELALNQISDGQRVLIVLYTLLHYLKSRKNSLIWIDEPDNFVALQEIQPWLISLCQAVEDHDSQVLLISHHPELINYLAPENAVVLSRSDGGHTRVKPFQATPASTLSPAELISRGWDSE